LIDYALVIYIYIYILIIRAITSAFSFSALHLKVKYTVKKSRKIARVNVNKDRSVSEATQNKYYTPLIARTTNLPLLQGLQEGRRNCSTTRPRSCIERHQCNNPTPPRS